ncbi:type II toxin-antitoxin system ParD family antitoxin [Methylobacterium sp. J-026]|uniref:type II toxin-antitoxin system ParD family antitoxin n=1 Tax=Methylobacterium sp. J-026 TaxID=2836624 RepID=UPI001FB98EF0|nr:type II toxin-antitoxin system ParD family antitoxin [Methylobacterium sp. J-026]MCJ2134836.1 type II toxin-antitoxin system ParD family antitoxin [Methylobacterium sp. J-026]
MPKTVIRDPGQEASRDRLIAAGRYGSPEEAVAAGVALLRPHEDRLATMPEAWREGVASGDHEPLGATPDALAARYAAMEKAGP